MNQPLDEFMTKNTQRNARVRLPIPTPDGVFTAEYSAAGLSGIEFPTGAAKTGAATEVSREMERWHALASQAVCSVLSGKAPGKLPPLDLSRGTRFQQQVWQALSAIAWGQTRSYGEVARAIGRAAAVRAVGGACGANPIPVLIPCHRVLAANRKLGGFSAGLNWKRQLLGREGYDFGA